MSYHRPFFITGRQGLGGKLLGLGAIGVEYTYQTNPPTPASQVWAPPGFSYLECDANGQLRPEYAAIFASFQVPGMGWSKDAVDMGRLQLNQAQLLGPYSAKAVVDQWSKGGLMVLYVAQYLGAPDGFFTPIATSNALKWANQPGVWVAKMPYNGPFTKDGWAFYLGQSITPGSGQPQPTPGTIPGVSTTPGSAIPQLPPPGTLPGQVTPIVVPTPGPDPRIGAAGAALVAAGVLVLAIVLWPVVWPSRRRSSGGYSVPDAGPEPDYADTVYDGSTTLMPSRF